MENTLVLEARGCDFFANDPETKNSDVGNYRVGVYDYSIHGTGCRLHGDTLKKSHKIRKKM